MNYPITLKRGWLWLSAALCLGVMLSQAAHVQADQSIDAPTAEYRVNLPLVMMSVQPPTRIQGLHALTSSVPRYGKFEVAFTISTTAENVYYPYDPAAPVDQSGVSVDLLLTAPNGAARQTPCFYYQPVDADLAPVGQADWRCRFAPDAIGTWHYRVQLSDRAGTDTSAGG